jgi:hypothetical protein
VLIGRENGVERDFALLRGELGQGPRRRGKGDPPRKPNGKRPAQARRPKGLRSLSAMKRLLILIARGWQLGPPA